MYKLLVKFVWKCKGWRIDETNLIKKNIRRPVLPDSKTYYKSMIIKTMWYWPTVETL